MRQVHAQQLGACVTLLIVMNLWTQLVVSAPTKTPQPVATSSDLWSGFIGAILGAVLAGVATFVTVWWQTRRLLRDERDRAKEARAEERQDALRQREAQALADLLPALNELQQAVPILYALNGRRRFMGSPVNPDDEARAEYAYGLLMHGLRVDLPLITVDEVRKRYRVLVDLADELARLGLPHSQGSDGTPPAEGHRRQDRNRQKGDVIPYIGYVRHTVKTALHEDPLPDHAEPPALMRKNDHALWSPPVTDPEDLYFTPPDDDDS